MSSRWPDSALIDRLVLGLPPSRQLTARILELREAGWTTQEIADLYGLRRETVKQRVVRARRQARHTTRTEIRPCPQPRAE